ncbi:MAG: hypothetical protein WA813_21630 [Beijerinckiaceae bacterium]
MATKADISRATQMSFVQGILKTSVIVGKALGSAVSYGREIDAAWVPVTSCTWIMLREQRAVPRSIWIVPISPRRNTRFPHRRFAWRNRTDRQIGGAVELLAVGRRRYRIT